MVLIQKAMDILLMSLREAFTIVILVRTKTKVVWNCFSFLSSYCSEIFDGKGMGALHHELLVTRLYTRCTATMEDTANGKCGYMRTMPHTLLARTTGKKLLIIRLSLNIFTSQGPNNLKNEAGIFLY